MAIPKDASALSTSGRGQHLPASTRIAIWLVGWALLLTQVPMFSDATLVRWLLAVLFGLSMALLALYARVPPQVIERSPAVDRADGAIIEGMVARALERADRAVLAWLTILGAAHSALIGFVASKDNFLFDSAEGTSVGALLVVVGVLCYAAHHAMSKTRRQAERALKVAGKLEPSGKYFRFVYRDEHAQPAVAGQLVPMVALFGYLWMASGVLLVGVHYLFRMLGL